MRNPAGRPTPKESSSGWAAIQGSCQPLPPTSPAAPGGGHRRDHSALCFPISDVGIAMQVQPLWREGGHRSVAGCWPGTNSTLALLRFQGEHLCTWGAEQGGFCERSLLTCSSATNCKQSSSSSRCSPQRKITQLYLSLRSGSFSSASSEALLSKGLPQLRWEVPPLQLLPRLLFHAQHSRNTEQEAIKMTGVQGGRDS